MMNDEMRLREAILPWDSTSIARFYERRCKKLTYSEEFVELFLEARKSFIVKCPRASIIMSGEALQRALFDMVSQLADGGREFSVDRKGRKGSFTVSPNTAKTELFVLDSELNFAELIELIQNSESLSVDVVKQLHTVRLLRNRAVHGRLPTIDYWDPDEPRTNSNFVFDQGFSFPEGYQFELSDNSTESICFACRDFNCGSLKPIEPVERLAVIQYLLTLRSLEQLIDVVST